jgi:D-glycero-D-manno-heptose 1,7-bisphosphate phosphatase
MNKAIFFDRDGVINRERGEYTIKPEDFEFNPGIFKFMRIMQKYGYLLIVVSNQGGVSKGLFTKADVALLHRYMVNQLIKEDIRLTEVYYCPHHDDIEMCLCRKPESLMIEKALARFDIDPAASYLFGDSDRDIEAGEKAGVKSVKIAKNQDLNEFTDKIIKVDDKKDK